MNATIRPALLVSLVLLSAFGCISVKTESEIKPIHITMDINLKVDKELDKAIADEDKARSQNGRKAFRSLLDRKVAGITAQATLEPREGASDDDKIAIAEANARWAKRVKEIAASSGVATESVQRRYARKITDRIPAGSGVWYQDDAGKWLQK